MLTSVKTASLADCVRAAKDVATAKPLARALAGPSRSSLSAEAWQGLDVEAVLAAAHVRRRGGALWRAVRGALQANAVPLVAFGVIVALQFFCVRRRPT